MKKLIVLSYLTSLCIYGIAQSPDNKPIKDGSPKEIHALIDDFNEGKAVSVDITRTYKKNMEQLVMDQNEKVEELKRSRNNLTSLLNKTSGEVKAKIDSQLADIAKEIIAENEKLEALRADSVVLNKMIIAKNSWFCRAVICQAIPGIWTDDAVSLRQAYLAVSLPLRHNQGISANSSGSGNLVWFRNVYFQPQFNISGSQPVPLYTVRNNPEKFYVNNMDILQYSYMRLGADINILTWINHNKEEDKFHVYASLTGGFLFVKDTNYIYKSANLEGNNYLGGKLSVKTEPAFSDEWTIEGAVSVCNGASFTSAYSNNLNVQYRKLTPNDTLFSNSTRLVGGTSFPWFLNCNIKVIYKINKSETSLLFLHFNYFQNIPTLSKGINYKNSYFQFQVGYAIDLKTVLPALYKSIIPDSEKK